MRHWASKLTHPETVLHGFDSFDGLPDKGGPWLEGQLDVDGRTPVINDARVTFFKGLFEETLPHYDVPCHDQLIINLDADLYSSTIYVLRQLAPHIRPGSFIYFDEFVVVNHELAAFDHFIKETGIGFRLVSSDMLLKHVLFECINVP